jgi:hypothetical protein
VIRTLLRSYRSAKKVKIPFVLYVPDGIDDDSIELIETAQFLLQSEIPLGCQQALDQAECRSEEDRMILLNELMTDRAH